jgi:hypothetical protein
MRKFKVGDLLLVEWIDAIGPSPEWENTKTMQPQPPESAKTVGFLVEDEPDYLVLTQTLSGDDCVGRFTIIKSTIKGMYKWQKTRV